MAKPATDQPGQCVVATIMFLDMIGEAAVSQPNEALAPAQLADLRKIVRSKLSPDSGREVRATNTHLLVEFASPQAGVEGAKAIQEAIQARNAAEPKVRRFQVRIGLHQGEVMHTGNDLHGDGVSIATQIAALASPGGICLTQAVLGQVVLPRGLVATDMGPTRLEDFSEPIPLFQILPSGTSQSARTPVKKALRGVGGFPTSGALSAILVAAFFFWVFHKPSAAPVKQVVVLPFRAISSGVTDQALGDGFVETLASRLTQLQAHQPRLRVVPMADVRHEHVGSAGAAHASFGATHALVGSIERQGPAIRINLALVNALTQTQIRACTTNGQVEKLFALQDDLAVQAAGWLGVEADPVSSGPAAAAAYEQYLVGVGKLARYDVETNVAEASVCFQKAVELDSGFAAAQAGLAEAFWRQHQNEPAAAWAPTARQLARRALLLNTNLARPYVLLGAVAAAQGAPASEEISLYQRALAADPFDADAWAFLADAYQRFDLRSDALNALHRAADRFPRHWSIYNRLGVACLEMGRLPEALDFLRQATACAPDCSVPYFNAGSVLMEMGRFREAETALLQAKALSQAPDVYYNLGNLYLLQHRYQVAVAAYQQAAEGGLDDPYFWGNFGTACGHLPDQQVASIRAYDKAVVYCRRDLAERPGDAVARSYLATYLLALQRNTEALKEIETALREAPRRGEVLFNAALTYEAAGQPEQAHLYRNLALSNGYPEMMLKFHSALDQTGVKPSYGPPRPHPASSPDAP